LPSGVTALRSTYPQLSDKTLRAYLKLMEWLRQQAESSTAVPIIGVSGAQGTGKSTLCDFISQGFLGDEPELRVLVLSLDDFYHTLAERQQLSKKIHPLLITRGVPGTHDVAMLTQLLDALLMSQEGDEFQWPAFDKLSDDRLPPNFWRKWQGRPDLILLEGWCVGATAQSEHELQVETNCLEEQEDQNGVWRRWVNQRLQTSYQPLFQRLDKLAFLDIPSFEQVFSWRMEQEVSLSSSAGSQVGQEMTKEALEYFIMHFERITRSMLEYLPTRADLVLTLDSRHEVTEYKLASSSKVLD